MEDPFFSNSSEGSTCVSTTQDSSTSEHSSNGGGPLVSDPDSLEIRLVPEDALKIYKNVVAVKVTCPHCQQQTKTNTTTSWPVSFACVVFFPFRIIFGLLLVVPFSLLFLQCLLCVPLLFLCGKIPSRTRGFCDEQESCSECCSEGCLKWCQMMELGSKVDHKCGACNKQLGRAYVKVEGYKKASEFGESLKGEIVVIVDD